MSRLYQGLVSVARRFFAVTRIPVPSFARRAHRRLGTIFNARQQPDLRQEVEALRRTVERLETIVYIDRVGRPPD